MTALEDGLYLNLPESIYFAQPRLGSTDMARLHTAHEGWWWSSPRNPDYVDEPEDAKHRTFGKALHAFLLEGDAAFKERFAVIPSKAELRAKYGDLFCITVGEMEAALEKRGMFPKRMRRDELIPYVRSRAPDVQIWDDIEAAWEKENAGKLPLTGEEQRQLQVMVDAVRAHKDVGPLFKYGPDNVPVVEATVFWTEVHGIREIKRRARFDGFFPQQCVDLKTLSNVGQRPLPFSVGDHLAKFGYHVQLADHGIARRWAYKFIQEGRVFNGVPQDLATPETKERHAIQRRWVERYPTEAPNWEFVLLFYQRPDSKKGVAPIVFPLVEDRGSELHMDGIRARRGAIQLYLQCLAQFGETAPWTRVEPAHTTAEGAPHRVFLPAYIAMPAVPGEDEDL